MNVSLTPKLEAAIKERIASGLYNNASEVIRDALRLLLERSALAAGEPSAPRKAEVLRRLAQLEEPLRRRGVNGLLLFGFVARNVARPNSDIDVLVEITPKRPFSLVDLLSLKDLLEDALGHAVDVVTREGLEPALKRAVLREAERVF